MFWNYNFQFHLLFTIKIGWKRIQQHKENHWLYPTFICCFIYRQCNCLSFFFMEYLTIKKKKGRTKEKRRMSKGQSRTGKMFKSWEVNPIAHIFSCTVFIPLAAHAPITAHQSYFQFEICDIIIRPLKSSHSKWVLITCQRYIVEFYWKMVRFSNVLHEGLYVN